MLSGSGCVQDIHDSVTEGISAAHKTHQFLGKGRIAISPEKKIRYSHVETAQYKKMRKLFNVFAQGVKSKMATF